MQIHLAATYLHARVTETLTNDNGLALFTPVVVGQMLPDAPNFSGSYIVYYEHPAGGKPDDVRAGQRSLCERASTRIWATPRRLGAGITLGARIGVKNPARHWDTSLWVTNLTDTRPLTYAFAGSEGQQCPSTRSRARWA